MDSVEQRVVFGKGMRIVVTGGAGFLGSHLCARLLRSGCSVVAIDNLSSGSMRNVTPLFGLGDFHFLRCDIVSSVTFQADWIFNMACCASPRHYQRDPVKTMRTCTDGVLNVLREARACRARVFQASAGSVYGEPKMHPQREDCLGAVNPDGPRACYDEGKRCAEAIFFDFHRVYGLDIKVARIFNTYGPHMQVNDGRVVSNFIVQALRNQPLTMYASGSQTRSLCYVDDMVDGVLRLMQSPQHVTGPVNLGSSNEISISHLARRIIDLTGSRSRIVRKPLPEGVPSRRCPDITLARKTLDWSPNVALENGLANTIAWFDSVLRHVPQLPSEPSRAIA